MKKSFLFPHQLRTLAALLTFAFFAFLVTVSALPTACASETAVAPEAAAPETPSPTLAAVAPPLFPFDASAENLPQLWNSPVLAEAAGAHGLVRVENEHFVNDAGLVRFWGINICMSANFPEKAVASAMARRIASFGLNVARLHHMDMREIWGKNYPHQLELDPEKLDRLDWLIAELKRNGIYVNINLHVSRKFTEKDGFPDYDIRPGHDKGLDNFMPKMIELQKKYARDLLTHVNPYTKMNYLEDPCVAVVEINNENSIVSQWRAGSIDKNLPPFCEVELQKLWNAWLKKKYASTEELTAAWKCVSEPDSPSQIPNSGFDSSDLTASGWHLENGSGSSSTLKIEDGKLVFRVEKGGTVSWEPQFFFTTIKLEEGKPYTVKFRARSSQPQNAQLACVQIGSPWGHFGLDPKLELTPEWKEFRFTFLPTASEDRARIGVTFVQEGTTLEFDDFVFFKGGRVGIASDERLEDGSIRVAKRYADSQRCTSEMRKDFTRFVLDLEAGYWNEMFQYVKSLGCRHPVTGTQLNYGSAYPQARMDYVDIHNYWNHPSFPSGAWSGTDWYVWNRPLVNDFGVSGTIASMASQRVLGKPYTVSEYNHPYPNLYCVEGFPMIAAAAGLQDWSGIFIFDWTHNPVNPKTVSFFDIHGNSPVLVHQPACHNLFVRGDVKSALPQALKTGQANIVEMPLQKERTWQAAAGGDDYASIKEVHLSALRHRALVDYSGVRLTDLPSTESASRTASLKAMSEAYQTENCDEAPTATVSSTGELIWNAETAKKGFFLVDTPKTKVFTGFVNGRTFDFSDGTKIIPGASILDWMTISLTQIDPASSRWLLAATGLVRNTDMKIRPYLPGEKDLKGADAPDTPNEKLAGLMDEKLTTCKTQGCGPNLCEGVNAKIQLPASASTTVRCWALTGTGERKAECEVRRLSDSRVEVLLSEKFETLWYEIQFEKK